MTIKTRLHKLEKYTGEKPMTWRKFIQSEKLPPYSQEQWEKSLALLGDVIGCEGSPGDLAAAIAEAVKDDNQNTCTKT